MGKLSRQLEYFITSGVLLGVGLLYGSPKTRPLFDRFHTFKLRLLGRENAN